MSDNKPNPFEEMQDEQIRTFFNGPVDRKIKAGIDGTMGTFRFLGNIADVYLTRFVDTMVGMANGVSERDEEDTSGHGRLPQSNANEPNKEKKYPNL